jgi:hypothetical protein
MVIVPKTQAIIHTAFKAGRMPLLLISLLRKLA